MLDTSREAQDKIRQLTESVDNFAAAKKELEPKGMTVVEANVDAFRKVAQEKIWPAYKQQFAGLWDQIVEFKAKSAEPTREGSSTEKDPSAFGLGITNLPLGMTSDRMPKFIANIPKSSSPAGRRDHQPADRRVPALRHDPGDGLARYGFHPLHLGRGGRRDDARLAYPDRRGDRRARARHFTCTC